MALKLRLLLFVLLLVLPSLRSSPTLHLATQQLLDVAPGAIGDIWKNCSKSVTSAGGPPNVNCVCKHLRLLLSCDVRKLSS